MIKYLLILIMLTGCATTQPIITKEPVHIDQYMLESCKPITKPEINEFSDVLTSTKEILTAYTECKNKLDANIIVLKKFSNNQ
jgi:hypothetical protein